MTAKWKLPYVKNGVKTADEYFKSKDPAEETVRSVLSDKLDSTEIEICFFTLCGLKCAFCYQDHDDPEGVTSIKEKADQVVDYLDKADNLLDRINFQLLGGELFEDNKGWSYYKDYLSFIVGVHEWCADNLKNKHTWSFTFITNLAFKKESTRERVDWLLGQLTEMGVPFTLSTSWDPTGRPLKFDIESWFHKNLCYYQDYVDIVTFVLTKFTCDSLLRRKNPYMEMLYDKRDKIKLQFDFFTPNGNSYVMMPDDTMLLNTLTMLRKLYPELPQIQAWRDNDINPVSCASLSRVSILPDGSMTACKHLEYRPEDFNTPLDFHSNASIIEKYVTQKECLGCEYFNKCTLGCFLADDHKAFKKNLKECFMKLMFKDIEREKK